MKEDKKLFILIVILLVVCIVAALAVLAVFIHANKVTKNAVTDDFESQVSDTVGQLDDEQEIELNSNELKRIEDILNEEENVRFLYSTYNNIDEVNLYFVFSRPKYSANEDEIKRYEELTNTELTSPLYKVSREEIEDLLTIKFGAEDVKEINKEGLTYLEEEDSYYFINCDDLSLEINCTSGTKNNNEYIVNYETKEDSAYKLKGTIKLYIQESDFAYFIISNKVQETDLY